MLGTAAVWVVVGPLLEWKTPKAQLCHSLPVYHPTNPRNDDATHMHHASSPSRPSNRMGSLTPI